jgi:hypothetical protein
MRLYISPFGYDKCGIVNNNFGHISTRKFKTGRHRNERLSPLDPQNLG